MSYYSRLKKAFKNAPVLPLNTNSRYIIFSDCHRGRGTSNDNFLKNQHLYLTALKYYYQLGFTYIELGDGDELWENRSMNRIVDIYNNIFQLLAQFHQEDRLHFLYGNHDIEKKNNNYSSQILSTYYSMESQCQKPLFPNLTFYESIILENPCNCQRFYLTHGHQASLLNSTFWPFARFLVRYLWKPAEHFGIPDPTSAAQNHKQKERTEQKLTRFAIRENAPLICGHTHRPMLNADSPYYMNAGSCVHPSCITGIEITGNQLSLVKWMVDTKKDRSLYVTKEVLSSVNY